MTGIFDSSFRAISKLSNRVRELDVGEEEVLLESALLAEYCEFLAGYVAHSFGRSSKPHLSDIVILKSSFESAVLALSDVCSRKDLGAYDCALGVYLQTCVDSLEAVQSRFPYPR